MLEASPGRSYAPQRQQHARGQGASLPVWAAAKVAPRQRAPELTGLQL